MEEISVPHERKRKVTAEPGMLIEPKTTPGMRYRYYENRERISAGDGDKAIKIEEYHLLEDCR